MKKIKSIIVICCFAGAVCAQQNVQYSQFMLNDYGLNPAVAGSSKGLFFLVGRRVQWAGFQYSPETNFASVTKSFGKKGFKRYWHGVGAYVEQDKFGIYSNKAASASYTLHLKMNRKYHIGFGVAAGIKSYAITNSVYDANDPALSVRAAKVIVPEITPGIYIYSKKVIAGIAVRNLYSNRLKQGSKEIGSNSRLLPNTYISVARKFVTDGYDFIIVPAVHIQTSFVNIPVSNFNCMVYYRKRVGVGLSYRMHDAVVGMIQVRIFSNVIVGFSYDYTISKFRIANANSHEFMMGFSPIMSTENYDRSEGAVDCPRFEL
jgi:type IX secretion system PorP/SprF family membrane protein